MFVDKIRERYNTQNRNLSLKLEIDSINFDYFMVLHQLQDEKEYLHCMVELLNNIIPLIFDCFRTESNNIIYFRNPVLGHKMGKYYSEEDH